MMLGGLEETLEGPIAESMMRDHEPGLSMAAVNDGRVVYARGFGARNLKAIRARTPPHPPDQYRPVPWLLCIRESPLWW